MSARSYLRGHPIYFDGEVWRYVDNDLPTAQYWVGRPCGACGEFPTAEGHDACLGTLPGVMNACCGHGQAAEAYLQYPDGSCLRGDSALQEICRLKLIAQRALTKP